MNKFLFSVTFGLISISCKKTDLATSDSLGVPHAGQTEFKINAAVFISNNVGLTNRCILIKNNWCSVYSWDAQVSRNGIPNKVINQVDKQIWCKVYSSPDYKTTTIRFAKKSEGLKASQVDIVSNEPFGVKKTERLGYTANWDAKTGYYIFGKNYDGDDASFGVSAANGKTRWTVWPLTRFNCLETGTAAEGYATKQTNSTSNSGSSEQQKQTSGSPQISSQGAQLQPDKADSISQSPSQQVTPSNSKEVEPVVPQEVKFEETHQTQTQTQIQPQQYQQQQQKLK